MESTLTRRSLVDGVIAPGLTLLVCAWFYNHIVGPDVDLEAMTRGKFGPAAWPQLMLGATMLCCALQFARRLWQWISESRGQTRPLLAAGVEVGSSKERKIAAAAPLAMPAEEEDPKIAAGAVVIIIAYGLTFEWMGFALSTLIFFVAWLLLGRLGRRPLLLVLMTLLGTLFNLYLFVKLAGMPLERGKWVFDGITVAIYRLLRIY